MHYTEDLLNKITYELGMWIIANYYTTLIINLFLYAQGTALPLRTSYVLLFT